MFPESVLGVKVELFYSGQWNSISSPTNYVRGLGAEDGEITIGLRGQPDESSGLTPTSAELSINNRDGRFSIRNAMSDLYGLIGLNTPIRISADLSPLADLVDSFDTPGTNGWPVSDSGHTYVVTGTASDYSVATGVGIMAHNAVNTEHRSTVDTVLTDIDVTVDIAVEALPTGAPVEVTIRGRISNAGNDWVQGRMVFTTSDTVQIGTEQSDDGVTTAEPLALVTGVDSADTISLRFQTLGRTIRVRAWLASAAEPSTWAVTQETDVLTSGALSLTSILETGNTNTLPYDVTFDNLFGSLGVILVTGVVVEWPKRWDTTGTDVWVPLQVSGITRRLVQDARLIGSPLFRAISQLDVQGYWSFEGLEGGLSDHHTIASSLEDGPALTLITFEDFSVAKIEYGGDDTLIGSDPLPALSLSDTLGLVGYDEAALPESTGNQFSLCFWVYSGITADDLNVETTIIILADITGGTFDQLTATVDHQDIAGTKSLSINFFLDDGALITGSASVAYLNTWRFIRFTIDQPAANQLRWRTYVDETLVDTETEAAGVPNIGQLSRIERFGPSTDSSNVDISYGHFAVAGGTGGDVIADNAATIYTAGYTGFSGETTVDRFTRLCTEEGITTEVTGTSITTMGPQRSQTFVETLEEVARTEDGILYELRSDFGYGFRSRSSLYDAPTRLTLDYANTNDLSEVPEVTDDDKDVVNRVEVKNSNGGTAIVRSQTTGPLSIENVGLHGKPFEVNLETDDQLADYAGWRLHVGTWDEQRWPGLSVALHRTPFTADLSKLAASAFLDVAEVVSVLNAPVWLGPDSILLQMRAVTMFLSNYNWGIDWTLLPAGPWNGIAALDSVDFGRLDTSGSEFVSAVDTDDTEFVIWTPETELPFTGALWTEDSGELNFKGDEGLDLRINPAFRAGGKGGERVRVAASASRMDTFTRSGQLSGSNADSGQTWANTSGTAADATTDGTRAVLLHGTANTVLWQTLPGPGADQLFNVDIAFNTGAATGGGALKAAAILRQTDTNNYVEISVTLPASGAAQADLAIRKVVGGVSTVVSSTLVAYSLAYTANTVIKVKAMAYRRGVFAKFWLSTSDEPDWTIELPNALADLVSGSDVALYSERATGNTNANATMYFDNLTVITPKIRPYASDMFGRSVSAGFGTADVGGAWSNLIFGGVAADLDVVNPAATTTHTAANTQLGGFLDDIDLTNVTVSHVLSLSALPTGASLSSSILLRGNAGPLAVVCRTSIATSTFNHALTISITAADGTALAIKTLGMFYTAAAQFRIKAAAMDDQIMMKVWDTAGNEPAEWQIVVEDTTASPISGWVGFLNERVTGNTNANAVISVYDWRVMNPQRMTVTRSVNSVQKSWPVGNDIRLWSPAILGR